jgi:hypothetical protein
MSKQDWPCRWLTEIRDDMARDAKKMETCYAALKNKDSNYGQAHLLVAMARREAESLFDEMLQAYLRGVKQ